MDLLKWFEKGLTEDQYISNMEVNRDALLHILNEFTVDDNDQSFFEQLKGQKLKVIVLTEDWCGDAMLNVPILLKLAKEIDTSVRFLYRDQNLELMDQYLTNGTSRAIPIFIFIDEEGAEKAVWGPRAQGIQQMVNEKRSALPPKDHEDFEAKQKEMFKELTAAYQSEPGLWREVYQSIKTTLTERLW
ncbi:MAG TPA: thioredoxin family protein [Chondromyces sp.]|nr:thioredoxin family protein [Chondromyces sp.]